MPSTCATITCDTYVVGGETDHITPWDGCYLTTRGLAGQWEFVLSQSGHIQSLINPPGNAKARFLTNPGRHATAEEFPGRRRDACGQLVAALADLVERPRRRGGHGPAGARLAQAQAGHGRAGRLRPGGGLMARRKAAMMATDIQTVRVAGRTCAWH